MIGHAQTAVPPLPSSPVTIAVPIFPPAVFEPLTPERLLELQRWTRDFEEWKAWFAKWHNRREPGWFSTRDRKTPPDPPEWLAGACAAGPDDDALAEGCRAWREWRRHDYLALLRTEEVTTVRAQEESAQKSIWWEHIHLDALWPMTQAGTSAFGVAGAHVTVSVSRRLEVFLAPGVMVMRLPAQGGGQAWSVATDWGFSYGMFDFRMPGTHRLSTLHLNLARMWVFGTTSVPLLRQVYLAGLSVTFKPRPGPPGE
jgi:hypothetical protein